MFIKIQIHTIFNYIKGIFTIFDFKNPNKHNNYVYAILIY